MLNALGLLKNKTDQSMKTRFISYIETRLRDVSGAAYPTNLDKFIAAFDASKSAVTNSSVFDSTFRVYTHAQGAPIEYLKCTQFTADGIPTLRATRIVEDTWETTADTDPPDVAATGRWVEKFSKNPLFELDSTKNYIMLDAADKACMFYERRGPDLLAKQAQHEAQAFMSKHGIAADMRAMEEDMTKDYRDLMQKVETEAQSFGLRL
jgi:hypothetical protein